MTILRSAADYAGQRLTAPDPAMDPMDPDSWTLLREISLDPRHLLASRIVYAQRSNPAAVAVDVLRTRLRRTLRDRGWTRIGVTSPTKGCGKTFLAANLALSMARVPSSRTLLIDMDLRIPSLARLLGVQETYPLEHLLRQRRTALQQVVRVGNSLALGLNHRPVPSAAELMQEPSTSEALRAVQAALVPDVVIYDLPPMLACDDVMAFLPNLDCVLLVASAGRTKAEDVRSCERLLAEACPVLGVVLNKADERVEEPYGYSYGDGR